MDGIARNKAQRTPRSGLYALIVFFVNGTCIESPLRFNGRAYDPEEYAHLNVSAEIKDLFQYIGRYKAHAVDLDTSLRCFVPDFIPAVGDMDAFLKVPRPDNIPDELGFKASIYRGHC